MSLKGKLEQYSEVMLEIEDLRRRIAVLEKELRAMENGGYMVQDKVNGGEGNLKHYRIEGSPYPEYSKKITLLIYRRQQLKEREEELLKLTNEVEKYISKITDSRIRRIVTYRYIDNLAWYQVAQHMGGKHTEESCRKAVERYLKKDEEMSKLSV